MWGIIAIIFAISYKMAKNIRTRSQYYYFFMKNLLTDVIIYLHSNMFNKNPRTDELLIPTVITREHYSLIPKVK